MVVVVVVVVVGGGGGGGGWVVVCVMRDMEWKCATREKVAQAQLPAHAHARTRAHTHTHTHTHYHHKPPRDSTVASGTRALRPVPLPTTDASLPFIAPPTPKL